MNHLIIYAFMFLLINISEDISTKKYRLDCQVTYNKLNDTIQSVTPFSENSNFKVIMEFPHSDINLDIFCGDFSSIYFVGRLEKNTLKFYHMFRFCNVWLTDLLHQSDSTTFANIDTTFVHQTKEDIFAEDPNFILQIDTMTDDSLQFTSTFPFDKAFKCTSDRSELDTNTYTKLYFVRVPDSELSE
jgi:hypothetical protein